jgi:hypothetical protein
MDRICVQLPDNLHDFIYCLFPLQAYQAELAVGAYEGRRDRNYTVTIRVDEKFSYFEPCFQVVRDNVPIIDYTGWNVQERGEYECFIDFDLERAKDVAKPSKRHITDGLGLIIGANVGINKWPILAPLQLLQDNPKHSESVLTINFPYYGEVTKFMRSYSDVQCVGITNVTFEGDHEGLLQYINRFDYVIGTVGIETYLAAALKKQVIELFPDDESYYLYNSRGIPSYHSVIGKATPEVVFALWEEMYQGVTHV